MSQCFEKERERESKRASDIDHLGYKKCKVSNKARRDCKK